MSETVSKAMWIGRMTRLPVVRRLILPVVFCALASLAVTASTSAATLFTNPNKITIPDEGNASPYPSEISVSGLNGPITDISVTLHHFGHADPDDVDVLLVSPSGKGVILMSDACGITEVEDFTWTFSQSAPRPISAILGDCADFAHQPANYGGGDFWPSPAPTGPYSTNLHAFEGDIANGIWRLYIVDASDNGASGDIEGGWSLSIDTGPVDVAIPGTGTSGPASFYPATRTVSGQEGLITDLNVNIDGIWHQHPDDLDLLLVGPQGQKVILMSDACGSFGVKALGWLWDDEAPAPMPDGGRHQHLRGKVTQASRLRAGGRLAHARPTRPLLHQPLRLRPHQPQRRVAALGQRRFLGQHGVLHQPVHPRDHHRHDPTHGRGRRSRQQRQGGQARHQRRRPLLGGDEGRLHQPKHLRAFQGGFDHQDKGHGALR
jgi:subtilisin-like proprotein convertase family protein